MKNFCTLLCAALFFTACSGSDTTDTSNNGSDSDNASDSDNGTDDDSGTDDGSNSTCTPGAGQCASDGISVQTCAADGSGFGAAVGCNGTTCANGACTTCAVGDTSCEPPCKQGTRRCTTSTRVEECGASGDWTIVDYCPNACANGACYGECVPGQTACCQDLVNNDGEPRVECASFINTCIGGVGCGGGTPPTTHVYLRGCSNDAKLVELENCLDASWQGGGAGAETVYAYCGACDSTGQLSCQNLSTQTCGPN